MRRAWVSNQNVTYKTKIINKRLPLAYLSLHQHICLLMPFMVVLSVHLSLSLLLISAQFFIEACVASTVACVENTGKPHLKLIVAVSHPLVQTAGWQGTVRDWSVVYSPLWCRCAETVVLNYLLHCWLVTLPPQEFDSTTCPVCLCLPAGLYLRVPHVCLLLVDNLSFLPINLAIYAPSALWRHFLCCFCTYLHSHLAQCPLTWYPPYPWV